MSPAQKRLVVLLASAVALSIILILSAASVGRTTRLWTGQEGPARAPHRMITAALPAVPTRKNPISIHELFLNYVCRQCSGSENEVANTIPRSSVYNSTAYNSVISKLGEVPRHHRKQWEFYVIYKTLVDLGVVKHGSVGLGFGVGVEPLPAAFASMGAQVVATDMDPKGAAAAGWADTNQFAVDGLKALHRGSIVSQEAFYNLVQYKTMDMNLIPDDLKGKFDFTWSSCSMEHVGDMPRSKAFFIKAASLLKPGGVSIHTTEFVLSSLDEGILKGATITWRYMDVLDVMGRLEQLGYRVFPLDLRVGQDSMDVHVDLPPYKQDPHLKLQLFERFVTTSIALVVQKPLR